MKTINLGYMDADEINLLSGDLDSKEAFILGFLKGFDRATTKKWIEKGLWEYEIR